MSACHSAKMRLVRGRAVMVPALFWLAAGGGPALAQAAGGVDAVDRQFQFIDKGEEAIRLFNEGRTADALDVFRRLAASYPDLDSDGLVALSIGDCLAALDRDEEARKAYQNAEALYAHLAGVVRQRLIELELSGEVSEALIDELRGDAQAEGEQREIARWQLTRGLQKRARSLLAEAVEVYRQASPAVHGERWIQEYASTLEEIVQDLGSLIEQRERRWGTARKPLRLEDGDPCAHRTPETKREGYSAEWTVLTRDGARVEFRMVVNERDPQTQVTVNGKPVELTPVQRKLVERHQDRIDAILLEAAQAARASAEAGK